MAKAMVTALPCLMLMALFMTLCIDTTLCIETRSKALQDQMGCRAEADNRVQQQIGVAIHSYHFMVLQKCSVQHWLH